MTADTAHAALQVVAERPGAYFSLRDSLGRCAHVRYENGCYYLKGAGPEREWDMDLEAAADMLCWLTGPVSIQQINGHVYEGGM